MGDMDGQGGSYCGGCGEWLVAGELCDRCCAERAQGAPNDYFQLTPSPGPHEAPDAFWPTPRWCTDALLHVHPIRTAWVIEPSAGEGAIAEMLAAAGHTVVAIELRLECDTALRRVLPGSEHIIRTGVSWLEHEPHEWIPEGEPFAIVGNPPYDPAETMLAHVKHAVCSQAQQVALLLPTSFLHSKNRAPFNSQFPPNALYFLARRPACREDKNQGGKRDLAFFLWDRKWPSRKQLISVIP